MYLACSTPNRVHTHALTMTRDIAFFSGYISRNVHKALPVNKNCLKMHIGDVFSIYEDTNAYLQAHTDLLVIIHNNGSTRQGRIKCRFLIKDFQIVQKVILQTITPVCLFVFRL